MARVVSFEKCHRVTNSTPEVLARIREGERLIRMFEERYGDLVRMIVCETHKRVCAKCGHSGHTASLCWVTPWLEAFAIFYRDWELPLECWEGEGGR